MLTKDGGHVLAFQSSLVGGRTQVNVVLFTDPKYPVEYLDYRVGNGVGEPPHKAFHNCMAYFIHKEPADSPLWGPLLEALPHLHRPKK